MYPLKPFLFLLIFLFPVQALTWSTKTSLGGGVDLGCGNLFFPFLTFSDVFNCARVFLPSCSLSDELMDVDRFREGGLVMVLLVGVSYYPADRYRF